MIAFLITLDSGTQSLFFRELMTGLQEALTGFLVPDVWQGNIMRMTGLATVSSEVRGDFTSKLDPGLFVHS